MTIISALGGVDGEMLVAVAITPYKEIIAPRIKMIEINLEFMLTHIPDGHVYPIYGLARFRIEDIDRYIPHLGGESVGKLHVVVVVHLQPEASRAWLEILMQASAA